MGAGAISPGASRSGTCSCWRSRAVLLAAVSRLRPRPMSLLAGSWLFATLAIWAALLRMPLYGVASLLLAVGLGRLISGGVAVHCQRPRQARYTVAGLLGLLVILAAVSTGWRTVREYRAMAGLPAPPSNARNVVLIVWDAVRAANLSLYGYPRDTTPNLVRWARKGVRYSMALAPAPWTYPSHSCFFTGHWPFQLNSQWKYSLDAPVPTLAEHLASRGYQTAGFSANTVCCSYETRLDRGFTHFEDYPLTPRSLLSRTVAGSWILQNILDRDDFYESKWIRVAIPQCERDQRRLPRLAGPSAKGSPLLRLLELLRRPRALHAPARICGPLRDPAPAPAGLPVPARLSGARVEDVPGPRHPDGPRLLRRLHRLPRRPARAAARRAPRPGASRQHAGDHHLRPRGIVRRSWHRSSTPTASTSTRSPSRW